jgi:hypothetical protein
MQAKIPQAYFVLISCEDPQKFNLFPIMMGITKKVDQAWDNTKINI